MFYEKETIMNVTRIEDDRLKPCPFCGEKPHLAQSYAKYGFCSSLNELPEGAEVRENRGTEEDPSYLWEMKTYRVKCGTSKCFGNTSQYYFLSIDKALNCWNNRV